MKRMVQNECEYVSGRMSTEQKIVLIEFMENHPDVAKGKFVGNEGRKTLDALWEELTTRLNNTEGPRKQAAKWKRAWTQLKNNTKRKATVRKTADISNAQFVTKGSSLNILEKKIISIMGEETVYGIQSRDVVLNSEERLYEEPMDGPSWESIPESQEPHLKRPCHEFQEHILQEFIEETSLNSKIKYEDEDSTGRISTSTSSSRSTPEREKVPSKTSKKRTSIKSAINHFMKSEEEFNKKIDKIVEKLEENNKLQKEKLEQSKKTNKLIAELIDLFKNNK